MVIRDLDDAAIVALSADRRFATAYNAALQTAKMALACAGYRVAGQGHHRTTFEAMAIVVGDTAQTHVDYFDVCRRKRNQVDYDLSGVATEAEVEELLEQADKFHDLVEDWIAANYAHLGRNDDSAD